MSKFRQNQTGSVVIVVLALVIVALTGAVGYLVYQNQHKAAQASTPTTAAVPKTTTTPTAPTKTTPSPTTFKVPELGIQLLNVPTTINDLNYAVTINSSTLSSALFSTISLSNLDKGCSPTGIVSNGALGRNKGTFDVNNDGLFTTFVKQFPGFWISYEHPQAACSDNPAAETLHASQTTIFQKLVMNPANIEAIQ